VIEISQLVINDMFLFLGNSFAYGGPKAVVSDFIKTFYPDLDNELRQTIEQPPSNLQPFTAPVTRNQSASKRKLSAKPKARIEGYTSIETFGGDQELLNLPFIPA
jgi:hypothetical protein